ncbi:MAG TPA: hypothetical protein VF182_17330 [Candidatus Binatia bacterium]
MKAQAQRDRQLQINIGMHGPALAILTLLFALRVLGQALVVFFSVDWLPPSEHWFSGLIPYPILLGVQLVMLAVMVKIASEIRRGRGFFAKPRPGCCRFLVACSILYAASMILRYILTMTYRPDMRWFGGTIPIFFHWVLAAFLYTWGNFNSGRDNLIAQRHR